MKIRSIMLAAAVATAFAMPGSAIAQSKVLFTSQPEIPAPKKCTSKGIPRSVLKAPKVQNDKKHTAFFGRWCRQGAGGLEEIAIVSLGEYKGEKKAHTVKMDISNKGGKVNNGFGVMFWDTRQKRWSLFTGGHVAWLQSNGNMAFGVAKKSGNTFRIAKGKKAQWGSYRKVR